MKKIYLLVILMLLTTSIFAQEVVEKFDGSNATDTTNYTIQVIDPGVLTLENDPNLNGATYGSALKVKFSVYGNQSWGGYSAFTYNKPLGTYWDFSAYDSVRIRYYIDEASTTDIGFRFKLYESPDTSEYKQNIYEPWLIESKGVTNNTTGWHELTLPLKEIENAYLHNNAASSEGFSLPDWENKGNNDKGNGVMDLHHIQALSFEYSVSGGVDSCVMYLDKIELLGERANYFVAYDGKNFPSNISLSTGWSGSAAKVADEDFSTDNNGSIKVSNTDQWDGVMFTSSTSTNLGLKWSKDSLSFAIKAEAGTGNLNVYFWDVDNDEGKEDYSFEAKYTLEESVIGYDGTWKQVKIALKDFDRNSGAWDNDISDMVYTSLFDSTQVTGLKFIHDDAGLSGKTIYLDNIWTGDPIFDIVEPVAPQNVSVGGADYINTITWTDVEGESGEVYNVYYSPEQITDLAGPKVESAKLKIAEGEEKFDHALRAPKTDQDLSYYYVVTCTDAAGNESLISANAEVTTTAKGVPVINYGAPTSFEADGDLSEWANIDPFVLNKETATVFLDGTGYSSPDNVSDVSAKVYLAADANNLYVAIDVEDDEVPNDTTKPYYYQDGIQIYFGLYDAHGLPHGPKQSGDEPDYELCFVQGGVYQDELLTDETIKFKYTPGFPTGYKIEACLPYSVFQGENDKEFKIEKGMRIPLDIAVTDIDAVGLEARDHFITYSPINQDKSASDVTRWLYTWIGEDMYTDVEVIDENIPTQYSLSQNYPNPFNPSTKLEYSLKEAGKVTLEIFNVLGQKVQVLVDEEQEAGTYSVTFDASKYASGVYFYTIKTGSFVKSKKMMLVK